MHKRLVGSVLQIIVIPGNGVRTAGVLVAPGKAGQSGDAFQSIGIGRPVRILDYQVLVHVVFISQILIVDSSIEIIFFHQILQ